MDANRNLCRWKKNEHNPFDWRRGAYYCCAPNGRRAWGHNDNETQMTCEFYLPRGTWRCKHDYDDECKSVNAQRDFNARMRARSDSPAWFLPLPRDPSCAQTGGVISIRRLREPGLRNGTLWGTRSGSTVSDTRILRDGPNAANRFWC